MTQTDLKDDEMRTAVEQFLLRRMRGDPVSVSQFVVDFPQLGESLAEQLRQAELVATAKNLSVDQRIDDAESSHGQLQIRCPHCQTLITMDADTVWADITCSSCDGAFSLIARDSSENVPALSQLAHFELLERIGVGAFGTVWRARDRQLDRIVALKIPRKKELSEKEIAMFMREARAAAQIIHPNVVRIYEVGRHQETLFIASEFIDGSTLSEWMATNRPGIRESAGLIEKVARGLVVAHAAGVTHRDLKPGNILIGEAGEPHVTDFGLAKHDAVDVLMTIDGALVGTPAYMAPEQAAGSAHDADARSDVYALGVILFQLLTGELPFRGTAATILSQVIHDEPPSPRKLNQNVPRDLDTICLKCLEKIPAQRFTSAEALADELQRFRQFQPIVTRPTGLWGRTTKWVRRRPAAAGLAMALLASLVIGSASSMLFALAARDRAQALAENVERLKNSAYAYEMTEVQRLARAENTESALLKLDQYADGTLEEGRRGPEWHFWQRFLHTRQLGIHRAEHRLRGLAASPDQTQVVWGAYDGHLFGSDPDFENVRELPGTHPSPIVAICFDAEGKRAFSLSADGTVIVTDIVEDLVLHKVEHPAPETVAMAVSHDGQRLIVGGCWENDVPSLLVVWNTRTLQEVMRLDGPADFLWSLEWGLDDQQLLLGGEHGHYTMDLRSDSPVAKPWDAKLALGDTSRVLSDGSFIQGLRKPLGQNLRRIRLSDGEVLQELQSHPQGWSELCVNATENRLAVPTAAKLIEIYELEQGSKIMTLRGHRDRVTNVEFLDRSDRLISTSDDRTVRLWDLSAAAADQGKSKSYIGSAERRFGTHQFALAPDGKTVAVWSGDRIRCFRVPELARGVELVPPADQIRPPITGVHLEFSHDSSQLASAIVSGRRAGSAIVWSVTDKGSQALPEIDGCRVSSITFSHDDQLVLAGTISIDSWDFPGRSVGIIGITRSNLETSRIWQPDDTADPWLPHRMVIGDLTTSSDGERVYSTGSRDRALKAWTLDGELLFTYSRLGSVFGAGRVAVSPSGQTIAVSWRDFQITLLDNAGQFFKALLGHTDRVSALMFTRDNRTLLSASWDGTLKLWDAEIGQLRSTLVEDDSAILGAGITPGGEWIVYLTEDGTLTALDCTPM